MKTMCLVMGGVLLLASGCGDTFKETGRETSDEGAQGDGDGPVRIGGDNDSCDDADGCKEDDNACTLGERECGCYGNSTCNDGLECVEDRCVETGDDPGGNSSTGGGSNSIGDGSGGTSSGGGQTGGPEALDMWIYSLDLLCGGGGDIKPSTGETFDLPDFPDDFLLADDSPSGVTVEIQSGAYKITGTLEKGDNYFDLIAPVSPEVDIELCQMRGYSAATSAPDCGLYAVPFLLTDHGSKNFLAELSDPNPDQSYRGHLIPAQNKVFQFGNFTANGVSAVGIRIYQCQPPAL